ncbi:D-arabinono-1,4-lactone oxidase, partial [Castellaniella defragrans]
SAARAAPAPATAPAGTAAGTAAPRAQWRNWSGLHACTPRAIATPGTEAEIATLLSSPGGALRCVGAGHSFTALVPTDDILLSLDRFSGLVSHDAAASTATLRAGTRLAQVSRLLDEQGLALRNLPDVNVQSFAGSISTGTHGTGAGLQALHADVTALRLVTPDGRALICDAGRPDLLAAARVSLGCLGVVTEITTRVVPAYDLERHVRLLPIADLLDQADGLARTHRNFEMFYLPFTGHAAAITHDLYTGGEVLMPDSDDEETLADLRRLRDWMGWFPSGRRRLAGWLIGGMEDARARNRSWKLLSTSRPSKFNETEYHVPREQGIACLRDVIQALERRNEAYFPLEFRYVKGDDAWLSPFHGRDCCSIAVHAAHGEAHDYLLAEIGPILRRHGGRPHWGKLHDLRAAELAPLYPHWRDFLEVRRELDPRGRLLNPYLRTLLGVA